MPKNEVNYGSYGLYSRTHDSPGDDAAMLTAGHMTRNVTFLQEKRQPGQRLRRGRRRHLQRAFLARVVEVRNIRAVCAELCISPNTFYAWLKQEPLFAGQYERLADGPPVPCHFR